MTLNSDGLIDKSYDGVKDLTADALNLKYGGQSGLLPNFGSKDGTKTFMEALNSQPYVKQNLIPFIVSLPRGLDYFPNSKVIKDTFISVFELHPESIEGISATLTAEMESSKLGKSAQSIRMYKHTARPEVNVSYTFREKHGKPLTNFLDTMILYLGKDEFDGPPLITKTEAFRKDEKMPTPLELAGFSTLFVEPDYSQSKVQDAYLVIGQQVQKGMDNEAKFNIEGVSEQVTSTIETGGILVYGPAIRAFGQVMLDNLKTYNINSQNMISPIDPKALDASVKESKFGLNGAASRVLKD